MYIRELKSQQEFSKKEEWFIKKWMIEKPVNQHYSEKDGNDNNLKDLLNTKHLISKI